MLSSISLTLNFTVTTPFNEDQLVTEITAAVRAAAQLHAQPTDKNEEILVVKDELSAVFKKIENTNRLHLEKGDIPDEGWGGMSNTNLSAVLSRLPENQRKVIDQAIKNGGQVNRAETFGLVGRSEEQSLRGFTKPVKSLTEKLQAKKELPPNAVALLSPIYDDSNRFQQAQGFTVPLQVVVKMRAYWKMNDVQESDQ